MPSQHGKIKTRPKSEAQKEIQMLFQHFLLGSRCSCWPSKYALKNQDKACNFSICLLKPDINILAAFDVILKTDVADQNKQTKMYTQDTCYINNKFQDLNILCGVFSDTRLSAHQYFCNFCLFTKWALSFQCNLKAIPLQVNKCLEDKLSERNI